MADLPSTFLQFLELFLFENLQEQRSIKFSSFTNSFGFLKKNVLKLRFNIEFWYITISKYLFKKTHFGKMKLIKKSL